MAAARGVDRCDGKVEGRDTLVIQYKDPGGEARTLERSLTATDWRRVEPR